MKKIFSFILIATFAISIFAQLPVNKKTDGTSKVKDLGTAVSGQVVPINPLLKDTLPSGDTLVYKIMITHKLVSYAYISELTKNLAADTLVFVRYYQSVDGKTNLQQLKTASQFNAPTYNDTISATWKAKGRDIDLFRKSVPFNSQYLIIWFKAQTNSGFKDIIYGSARINEY